MRVVAELPHPEFKISIFQFSGKYIAKFEQGAFEQSYKVSEMDVLDGINSVFELLDEAFLQTVSSRFAEMRKDFKESYKRYNY